MANLGSLAPNARQAVLNTLDSDQRRRYGVDGGTVSPGVHPAGRTDSMSGSLTAEQVATVPGGQPGSPVDQTRPIARQSDSRPTPYPRQRSTPEQQHQPPQPLGANSNAAADSNAGADSNSATGSRKRRWFSRKRGEQ